MNSCIMHEDSKYLIRTVSGNYVDLSKPSLSAVSLQDMTHSLGRINRFQGHTAAPITVLDHLLNTHNRACFLTEDPLVRYAALMHDAHECYVCDVPTPLKRLLGKAYTEIEDGWQKAVFDWAGLPYDLADHPVVKQADLEMLLAEAKEYHGTTDEELRTHWPDGAILSGDVCPKWLDPEPAFRRLVHNYRGRLLF